MRTRELMPSAPIRTWPRSCPPSTKRAVTPLSSCAAALFQIVQPVEFVLDFIDIPIGLAPDAQGEALLGALNQIDVVHAPVEQEGFHRPGNVIAPRHFLADERGIDDRVGDAGDGQVGVFKSKLAHDWVPERRWAVLKLLSK
jgi:hypothetical protein